MNQIYSLLAIVALGLGLELVYAYKIKTDKKRAEKFSHLYKDELKETKKKLEKLVDETKKESQELVSASLKQFETIQKELEEMSLKIQGKTESTIEDLVEWQKNIVDDQIRHYQHEVEKRLEESFKMIDETGKGEIARLSDSLNQSMSKTHREIIKALIESAEKADKEIQNFKKKQEKKLEESSK